jgi:methanesulfonate monooxygenase small subunit
MEGIELFMRQQQARDLVLVACLHLNASEWPSFLKLCDERSFTYSIVNFSPEIKRTQCWMKQDFAGLSKLLSLLPKHNSDRARLTRHVTPYLVRPLTEPGEFEVTSHVTVYRTEWDAEDSHLQSGATTLYVVGKYVDDVRFESDLPLLRRRVVDLDTRQVGIGSHHIL